MLLLLFMNFLQTSLSKTTNEKMHLLLFISHNPCNLQPRFFLKTLSTKMHLQIQLTGFSCGRVLSSNPLWSSVSPQPQRLASNDKKHSKRQQQNTAGRRNTGTVPGWDTCCCGGAAEEGPAVCLGCCCGSWCVCRWTWLGCVMSSVRSGRDSKGSVWS